MLKKIRGWLGNAVVWGGAWSVAAIPVIGALLLEFGYVPVPMAVHIFKTLFTMGFLAGGVFSTYLGLAYRDRGFDEFRPGVFAVVGGFFGGLLLPSFELLPRLAAFMGASFPEAMGLSIALAALLGGATAYGTIKVAKGATPIPGIESARLENRGRATLTEETA
jgi:hypothetical protein